MDSSVIVFEGVSNYFHINSIIEFAGRVLPSSEFKRMKGEWNFARLISVMITLMFMCLFAVTVISWLNGKDGYSVYRLGHYEDGLIRYVQGENRYVDPLHFDVDVLLCEEGDLFMVYFDENDTLIGLEPKADADGRERESLCVMIAVFITWIAITLMFGMFLRMFCPYLVDFIQYVKEGGTFDTDKEKNRNIWRS